MMNLFFSMELQVLCLSIKVDVEKTVQFYTVAKKFRMLRRYRKKGKKVVTGLAAVDCIHGLRIFFASVLFPSSGCNSW